MFKNQFWIIRAFTVSLLLAVGVAQAAPTIDQVRAIGARVQTQQGTGQVRFIGFDADQVARQTLSAAHLQLPPESAAIQHLNEYGPLFGLANPALETKIIKKNVEKDGRSMTRFQQHYQGIPVLAGEILVNQTAKNQLTSIAGRVSANIKLNTKPVVSAQDAQDIALAAMAKWYGIPAAEFKINEPQLSIYDTSLMTPFEKSVSLVWRFDIRHAGLEPINEFFAIDAVSGSISLHFNQIHKAKNRLTYDLNSGSVLPGTLICNESNPACSGGIPDAVYAHRYAGNTYDFYATNFGRNGIDDAGMTMISTVRYCPSGEPCPYANAFWNDTQMVYGAGYPVGEDVVAHELTHGVTSRESNLLYYYQSGAINESFSDVFGEFAQQSNPTGTVTPSTKWLMGEDLSIGAIRSMSNPTAFSDPDKMTSAFYYTGASDNGGVHTNSGVNNKAAYLMVEGGTFNGKTVVGLGIPKVAKIYYRVQTTLLTSGSDYLDLYNALKQSCQDLIGTASITSGDCASVNNAVDAVEMNLQPVAGFNPEAAMCPADQSVTSTLFSDGLEGGSANWTFGHTVGTLNWAVINDYASTGLKSIYAEDPTTSTDQTAAMTNGVALPASAHLWFKHAFGFEGASTYYDGGVVEYSANGGPWTDTAALFAEGKAYGGVVSSSYGNTLAGRSAFVDNSHGYVSTRLSLASLAGQTVKFRWRAASDSSTAGPLGWAVDDVRIHTCGVVSTLPGAPTNVVASPAPGGIRVSFSAPSNVGSSPIASYTATCTAVGKPTLSTSGSGSPITVTGAQSGASYTCSVTASNAAGSSSASASSVAVAGPKVDLTPILMMLLD